MVSVRPERPAQVIIIGAIEHGPELEQSRISQAVSHVARLFGARSRAAMTASSIEVVFDIPGSLGEPDFNGVQVGTSWPKAEELQVFAAVPSAQTQTYDLLIRGKEGRFLLQVDSRRKAMAIREAIPATAPSIAMRWSAPAFMLPP